MLVDWHYGVNYYEREKNVFFRAEIIYYRRASRNVFFLGKKNDFSRVYSKLTPQCSTNRVKGGAGGETLCLWPTFVSSKMVEWIHEKEEAKIERN